MEVELDPLKSMLAFQKLVTRLQPIKLNAVINDNVSKLDSKRFRVERVFFESDW